MKEPWFSIECEIDAHLRPPPSIRDIQRAVCRRFPGVMVHEINSQRRNATITRARHVALHLACGLTSKSYPSIAKVFGMDHTSVMYASRNIERLTRIDPKLRKLVVSIGEEFGRAL